jgi:hypothetical protein
MNRYSTIFGWFVVGLTALIIVNLIFFGFVVGLDIAFGEAPEFAAPIFVLILICIVVLIGMLLRSRRRSRAVLEVEDDSDTQTARATRLERSALRSVLVIRRCSESRARGADQERTAYETST